MLRTRDNSQFLSKEARIASENRILQINKLYQDSKKSENIHRDIVVSNNSTSVFHSDSDTETNCPSQTCEDECLPVVPPAIIMHRSSHKKNPQIQLYQESSLNSSQYNNINDADLTSEDSQLNDLHFTPRLKSRRSIIRLSAHSTPINSGRLTKKRGKLIELKNKLGDPIPLPYLAENQLSMGNKNFASRWRSIVSKDTNSIEKRLQEIRDNSASSQSENHSNSNTHESRISRTIQSNTHLSPTLLHQLRDSVDENTKKIDLILNLLRQNKWDPGKEILFWSVCIFLLIISNIGVYYYL